MHLAISVLLSIWTLYLALQISDGVWDSIILVCWINWPLYLASILIYARHRPNLNNVWKLRDRGDFLLVGAFIPLVLGIVYFNLKLASNSRDVTVSFGENLFFVGVFSVAHWFVIGLSVLLAYFLSKYFLKN